MREKETDNEKCVIVGSAKVVRGKNGDFGPVDGGGVVLQRCEFEVNGTKHNGRKKGNEKKDVFVVKCFF